VRLFSFLKNERPQNKLEESMKLKVKGPFGSETNVGQEGKLNHKITLTF